MSAVLTCQDSIAWVRLQRPEVHNALNRETFQALDRARRAFEADDGLRVMVIHGSGKAFGAGSDLKELENLTQEKAKERVENNQQILDDLEKCPKPILAAMHGYVLGAGLELALCCHLRVACETATFGFPEITLGLFPALGGMGRLQALVGQSLAMDMILTGRRMSAPEALSAGLISRVSPEDDFQKAVQELAKDLARQNPKAIDSALQVARGTRPEADAFAERLVSSEVQEAIKARIWKAGHKR